MPATEWSRCTYEGDEILRGRIYGYTDASEHDGLRRWFDRLVRFIKKHGVPTTEPRVLAWPSAAEATRAGTRKLVMYPGQKQPTTVK